ncbi:MAG TPA: ABC transporter permease [Pyrinomonadaceae bacterium]
MAITDRTLSPAKTSDTQSISPRPTSYDLPAEPVITIQPSKTSSALRLSDLWAYRELLYFLIWRDVKVRYKQTVLGVAWAILQPLFMMLIFSLLFGSLAGIGEAVSIPYPLFAFAGLVLWTFFSAAVTTGSNSLVNNSGLITKVYFPRVIVPIAAVSAALVDLVLTFIVLIGMLFYYRVTPTVNLLMLVPLVAMTYLFALGVGIGLSALNVKYRDVRFALPFMIQLWLFISSVIVPASLLGKWQWLLIVNPMSSIIEAYRAALFGQPFHWPALALAAVIIFGVLVYSAYFFRRVEKTFADII